MAAAAEFDLEFQTQFIQEKLEEVRISSAEEEDYSEYLASVWNRPPNWNESDDGSSSPGSEEGDSQAQVTERNFRRKRLTMHPIKAHLREFIGSTKVSNWNISNAEKVYDLFNATMRIIHPNELLSASCLLPREHITIENILKTLSSDVRPWESIYSHKCVPWQRHCPKWEDLPKELMTFVSVFTETAELAHVFHDKKKSTDLLLKFQLSLEAAQAKCIHPHFVNFLVRLRSLFLKDTLENSEKLTASYITLLLDVFTFSAGIPPFHADKTDYTLSAGRDGSHGVIPDFIFQVGDKPFMIGEVKRFGTHGPKHEHFRGRIPSDPTGKQECSDVSKQYESSDGGDNYPGRSLGSREWYKVRGYLPQLMGELLAVMQSQESPPKICSQFENVELGFAVEGFKLRFVKLVIRPYLRQDGRPNVEKFLHSMAQYKCDVFLTQEFNLFRAKHLVMFFKMLLAIYYHMT